MCAFGNFIFFYSGSSATLSLGGAVNPAALKIKGSPSDMFNKGKSNQERKLTGTEVLVVSGIRSRTDSRSFRKERIKEKKDRN